MHVLVHKYGLWIDLEAGVIVGGKSLENRRFQNNCDEPYLNLGNGNGLRKRLEIGMKVEKVHRRLGIRFIRDRKKPI